LAEEPEIDRPDELEARPVDSLEEAPNPGQPNETSTKAELVAAFESHSGPLPNRQWFEAIESLHPGTTEMIIKDYADEREHQRQMQREALRVDEGSLNAFSDYQLLRLKIVGFLAAFFALSGLALIIFDKPIYGFVLLVAEIAGVVLAFFGRRRQLDDDAEDAESIDDPI
jgi:uncharacterized membrane protein